MARHDAKEGSSTVTVHVYRAEEGGFWAEMPDYPGCYTQGETMDELEENVREAVQCYLDAGYADQSAIERQKRSRRSYRSPCEGDFRPEEACTDPPIKGGL